MPAAHTALFIFQTARVRWFYQHKISAVMLSAIQAAGLLLRGGLLQLVPVALRGITQHLRVAQRARHNF